MILSQTQDSVRRLFQEHPESVGETYVEHMRMAGSFAWRLQLASLACLVHAVLPFLFVKTGSTMIMELYTRMVTHRDRRIG